jgi:inosine-uridine nucleoside N-ribohydrolase
VQHSVHIDEADLDAHDDYRRTKSSGSFTAALRYMSQLSGPIDLIVGGPLTEVAAMMRNRTLAPKLGNLTCQLGLFGFGDVQTMAGGGITFNSAADPAAARAVLSDWSGQICMVPTDVTKTPAVGFDTPQSVRQFGLPAELVELYEVFYRAALAPRGERIYPHDVHSTFAMAQIRRVLSQPVYNWQRVLVTGVGNRGQIQARFTDVPSQSKRFVVKSVNPQAFMQLLRATLQGR